MDEWAYTHRDEMVRDIMELVSIPSVSGEPECQLALQRLAQMGERFGFAHEMDDDFSVSILHPGCQEGAQELGLLGHLDVVPAGNGWRFEPFRAVEKNGYIVGRGSADNKGPVVVCLYVLRCLKELNLPLAGTVRLIAGCREETDMLDVKRYLQTHEPPFFTLNCDGAWACCIGEKGILEAELTVPVSSGNLAELRGGTASNTVPGHACAVLHSEDGVPQTVEVHGKAAHCCVPQQGENAIVKLLDKLCGERLLTGEAAGALERLRQCFPDDNGTGLRIHHEDSLSGRTTCVPVRVGMENGVVRLRFNARTALSQRKEWMLSALEKRLGKLNIQLENVRWVPPRHMPADLPEVRLLTEVCQEHLNPCFKPYVMGGATHSRFFPRSLPFGPEVLDPRIKRPFGKAHGPDEAVCIDELLRAVKIYVIALKRLDEQIRSRP